MAGSDERRRKFDDLFDDLDRFFAPEGEEDEPGRPDRVGPPPSGGDEVVQLPEAQGSTEGEVSFDTELLPSGWIEQIGDLDLPPEEAAQPAASEPFAPTEAETPAAVVGDDTTWRPLETATTGPRSTPRPNEPTSPSGPGDEEAGRDEHVPAPEDAPEPEDAPAPETTWTPQATGSSESQTAEMSRDDWSRLREVLGEEEEGAASFLVGEPDQPPDESVFDLEGLREAAGAAGPPGSLGAPAAPEWSGSTEQDEPATSGESRPPPGRWARRRIPSRDSAPQPAEGSGEDDTHGLQAYGEEPPELTLEDMKKPPPQYRDLPRAEPDEEGPMVGEVPPSESREPDAPEEPSRPFWEDVDITEIERAADEVADEFASSGETGAEDDLLADLDRPARPRTVRVGEPETLTGPSWEEPGSRPLIPEPTPPPGGRNLPLALLTGIGLAAFALILLALTRAGFAAFAGIVALVAQAELYASMQRRGFQPATALGLVLGGLTLAAAYLKGEPAMLFFLALGLLASFVWYMASPPKAREGSLGNVAATVLGLAYVPFLGGFILVILSQANSGRALILSVLGLTILYDVVAFASGSVYGSTPLAPTISPKKTREGLVIASLVTLIFGSALIPLWVDMLTIGRAFSLALVVVIFAPLGDLAESMIKRDMGIKDSGIFLPGHGGALDRIDSILFVAPAAFYLFRLIF